MTNDRRDHTSALIVAAGEGRRMGGQPKALIEFDGKTLVQHVTEAAMQVAGQVIVGVRAADQSTIEALLDPSVIVVTGGDTRQETVEQLLGFADRMMVLIHDVARPFASQALYVSVLDAAFDVGGAAPILRASTRDSIALADGDTLGDPLPRDRVVRIQTPYAYRRTALIDALGRAREAQRVDTSVTSLLTHAGYATKLVPGDPANIKITYPKDLAAAKTGRETSV